MTVFVMFAFNVALIITVNSNPFAFLIKTKFFFERINENMGSQNWRVDTLRDGAVKLAGYLDERYILARGFNRNPDEM